MVLFFQITGNQSRSIKIFQWEGGANMLTEERQSLLLEAVNRNRSIGLNELCQLLNTSESTIRRDLSFLAEKGLLTKVRGGAMALDEKFTPIERNMDEKSSLFVAEKDAIARYAASLVQDGDCVFMDAGTTAGKMTEYLSVRNATFVTIAFTQAKKLAQKGYQVFVPAGEIKASTEAIVGAECQMSLQKYHFNKCFVGVDGISLSGGFTTPDQNEACVKTTVMNHSQEVYILADHSKFDKITSVTFAALNRGIIITDRLQEQKYNQYASVREVCRD